MLRAPWPKIGYWKSAHGPVCPPLKVVEYVSTALLPPPGGVSSRYEMKFVAPVRIGDTVTTALTLTETRPERRELVFRAQTTNQRGETVLEGQTVLKLI